jgi:uncharacterized protein (TIGR03083 family)
MDRLAIIDSESHRFARALSTIDPQSRCPTCPGWSAADLLWHLTEVHYFWAEILAQRLTSGAGLPAIEEAKPARPAGVDDMLELRADATARLLRELADRDDTEPCWSWWPPDQTVGFTRRMQTYEATMHRVDAELAAGVPVSPIAADAAAGAVDHAVDVMWGWLPEGAAYRCDDIVKFVATDTGATWLVDVGSWTTADGHSAARAVRANGGDPTAVVSGAAQHLALWAWTRGDAVSISGESAALDALMSQGIQ